MSKLFQFICIFNLIFTITLAITVYRNHRVLLNFFSGQCDINESQDKLNRALLKTRGM